ncbi:hypothetical protein DRJ16_01240 [Candidatus Woesearchaeota archaeon]|nr:MAG: hypothetical protein DRJ16_01240 [Candidatus Woesearchaeota archaeon]
MSSHSTAGGFNAGLKIVLKDKDTKENLNGYATIFVEGRETRSNLDKTEENSKIVGKEKILAIKQVSDRCGSSVEKGNFDCTGNWAAFRK